MSNIVRISYRLRAQVPQVAAPGEMFITSDSLETLIADGNGNVVRIPVQGPPTTQGVLPLAGGTGQLLSKASAADYDAIWTSTVDGGTY